MKKWLWASLAIMVLALFAFLLADNAMQYDNSIATGKVIGISSLLKSRIFHPATRTYFIPPGSCTNNIPINSAVYGTKQAIGYSTCFTNNLNLTFHFYYDNGKLWLYMTRPFNGREPVLAYSLIEDFNFNSKIWNVYSNSIRMDIDSFNRTSVTLTIFNDCPSNPFCAFFGRSLSPYYHYNRGIFNYYFNRSLFPAGYLPSFFAGRFYEEDNMSYNFLRDMLGFVPPVDTILEIKDLTSGSPHSGASGFAIVTFHSRQFTSEWIAHIIGNTHELVHVFLYGIPVKKSFFEEGLADYMQQMQMGTLDDLICRYNGWEDGGPYVLYSNLSSSPLPDEELYSQYSRRGFYATATCFWKHINETYGETGMRDIATAWNNARYVSPPSEKWFIRDIVNPALHANMSDYVFEKYGYRETIG